MARPAPRLAPGAPSRPGAAAWALALGLVSLAVAGIAGAAGGPASPEPEGTVVLRAPWGAGSGELGRLDADESAPEGPMSFTVTARGELVVLDQVNARVVRFDAAGKAVETIPVGSDTVQDVAVGPGGELVLLDRLVARDLRALGPGGRELARVAVEGEGIPEGGGITAMLARPDGVWLEYEHRRSVRVLDATLHEAGRAAGGRAVVAGRPVPGGLAATARIAGPARVQVTTMDPATDLLRDEAWLAFDDPVFRIVALEPDRRGGLVVAVHTLREDPEADFAVAREVLELRLLDGRLKERRRILSRPSAETLEQFKELEVGPDGAIYRMGFTASGVEVRRWAP